MDLKLFTQRFYEFVNMTESFSEVHDYVHKLCTTPAVSSSREAKVQLVRNLMSGFAGLAGDSDEIILTSILNLLIKRNIPDEDSGSQAGSLIERKRSAKALARMLTDLREWQDVMFEAGVPENLLRMIDAHGSQVNISNRCLTVLNNIMAHASDEN